MLKFIVVAFVAATFGHVAHAEQAWKNIAFQMRLAFDGVLAGPTDGSIGPGTRKAMAAYAEKFAVENNRKAIEADMVRRASLHQVE